MLGQEGKKKLASKVLPVPRLKRNSLSIVDVAASTMANIAPAMSFYFSFGLIAATSGIAAPITIIIAALAIGLLGNSITEFSKYSPSTGSFVTFIGKGFGPISAISTAISIGAGYILAMGAVVVISGGWASSILAKYLSLQIPWQLLTVIFSILAVILMVSGVKISTRWAAIFFAFEMLVLVVGSILMLITHPNAINLKPFNPSQLLKGFSGISLGFPLAIFLFIGWENSAALAEETQDPRKNVGKAIFYGVLIMTITYVFLSYSTVVGFSDNLKAVSNSSVPFIEASAKLNAIVLFLAYLAGFTSIMSSLISATNSQARIVFNSAREGLLPSWIAKLSVKRQTPVVSIVIFQSLAVVISFVFGWKTNPVTFFGEIATLGTILISVAYMVSNLALPSFMFRYQRNKVNIIRHFILPIIGALTIAYPLYELIKPGQPSPFDYYPYIAAVIIIISIIYAGILNAKDKTLGQRVGSILADEE